MIRPTERGLDMDYYDDLIRQRGETASLAIIADDARKLRQRLHLIRLIAAVASARELCKRGITPAPGNWKFQQGWCCLMAQVQEACPDGPTPWEAVTTIAGEYFRSENAGDYILQARSLEHIMSKGFIPPDPRASEDHERGWIAACEELRISPELHLLTEAMAEALEEN